MPNLFRHPIKQVYIIQIGIMYIADQAVVNVLGGAETSSA